MRLKLERVDAYYGRTTSSQCGVFDEGAVILLSKSSVSRFPSFTDH
jgi:hypothetical protein